MSERPIFVDTRKLIQQMKEHPALWDSTSDNYKSIDLKARQWRKLAHLCVQNIEEIVSAYPDGEEKAIYRAKKRWKSIRDSYHQQRTLFMLSKEKKIRKYMYAQELQFLDKILPAHPTRSTKHDCNAEEKPQSTNFKTESSDVEDPEPPEKKNRVDPPTTLTVDECLVKQSNEEITQSISRMICMDKLPISFVDGAGFKLLLSKLCPSYKIPNRKTISGEIDRLYDLSKTKLKEVLQSIQFVSLSLETWKSRNLQYYMSVNCHFISDEWQPKSFNLGTEVMDEYHTSNHILEKLENIIRHWEVEDKLVAIVHDEEDNLKKAINESVFLKQSIFCFAHTLQLIIDKCFSEVEEIDKLLEKCSSIVSHFKNSAIASDSLKQQQAENGLPEHKLIHSIKGNWSSTYKMLNRLVEQKQALIVILDGEEETLGSDDWELIENLIKILNPFDAATILLNCVSCPTLSMVQPIVKSIFTNYISNIDSSDNSIIISFKSVLQLEFKKRFYFLYVNTVDIIDYATFLDPRYKNLLKPSKAKVVKVFLKRQLEDTSTEDEVETKIKPKLNESSSAFSVLFPDSDVADSSDVVDMYNSEPEILKTNCPLKWWKSNQSKFPGLALQARKYFSIQSTSTPVDKAFVNPATANANKLLLKPYEIDKIEFLNRNF